MHDDDDDDDDDVLTSAHFPEILPVMTKQAVTKYISMEENKQVLKSVHGSIILLRGAIVNRTYGILKNLYVYPFLLTIFGPVNYGPP